MLRLPFTAYDLTATRTPCPLCSSDAAQALSRWDRHFKRLPHVKCSDCGLIRQEFMPTAADLDAYYRTRYRAEYQNVAKGPSDRHVAKRRAEAAIRLDRLAKHLSPGATLIDFGCGSGEFVESAAERGFRAEGFEPGEQYATHAIATRGLRVRNCGWDSYAPVDGPVGAVTSFHVFEHLTDPLSALRRATEWLQPGGLVYLEVPNMANALYKGFGCLHLAHVIGFGRYNMELLGALAGLQVVEVFADYDIGMIFRPGQPRDLRAIKADARAELANWTQEAVHRRYWGYTFGKLIGRRRKHAI